MSEVSDLAQRVVAVETNQKQHHSEIKRNRSQLSELEKETLTNHLDHVKLMESQAKTDIVLDKLDNALDKQRVAHWKLYTAVIVIVAVVPKAREALIGMF